MRKAQKNFVILICAILLAILLLLAAIFQDKLIYIATQAWSGISGTKIRIEESESRVNYENEQEIDDSYIRQEESMEIEAEQSMLNSFQIESSSVTEYDSNIQVFPSFEEESNEVSESSSVLSQESQPNDESSVIIEESEETIEKSKLTEFPITPY